MKDPQQHLYSKFRIAQLLTRTSYGSLLILFVCINVTQGSMAKWLMQSVPLLIVLPGLMRNTHRSYSWLCFVVLIYFTAYVVEVMSPLFVWTDAVALGLSVVIFMSALFASRWLQHWQSRSLEHQSSNGQSLSHQPLKHEPPKQRLETHTR